MTLPRAVTYPVLAAGRLTAYVTRSQASPRPLSGFRRLLACPQARMDAGGRASTCTVNSASGNCSGAPDALLPLRLVHRAEVVPAAPVAERGPVHPPPGRGGLQPRPPRCPGVADVLLAAPVIVALHHVPHHAAHARRYTHARWVACLTSAPSLPSVTVRSSQWLGRLGGAGGLALTHVIVLCGVAVLLAISGVSAWIDR